MQAKEKKERQTIYALVLDYSIQASPGGGFLHY